jgi:hypothetical protein
VLLHQLPFDQDRVCPRQPCLPRLLHAAGGRAGSHMGGQLDGPL